MAQLKKRLAQKGITKRAAKPVKKTTSKPKAKRTTRRRNDDPFSLFFG